MNATKTFLSRLALAASFFLVATMPPVVDAGSLGSIVGKAALGQLTKGSASKSLGRVAKAQGSKVKRNASAGQKPRDVIVSRKRHPQAAAHIEHAQRTGQPTILHIDRKGASKRRTEAIGNINLKRRPGAHYERDEYPPAFTREGGSNANVRFIRAHDNRGAGSSMSWQTRDLPEGSKIRVLVK
jgi:hypothetical protein